MAHVDDALEHVGYEWWMFRELFELLDGISDEPDPVRNALLESLTLHGRVLGRFFTSFTNRSTEAFNAEDTGIGVALVPEPPEMEAWRKEMNGRVAHLLMHRVDPKKDWGALAVRTFLDGRIAVLKARVAVPVDWIGDRTTGSKLLQPGAHAGTGSFSPTMPAQVQATPPTAVPAASGAIGPKGKL